MSPHDAQGRPTPTNSQIVGDSETIIRWHLDERWVGVDVAFMGNLGEASRIRTGRFQISQLACGD